jgi:hypothetical protein
MEPDHKTSIQVVRGRRERAQYYPIFIAADLLETDSRTGKK